MALCRAIADPLPQAVWRALTAEPVAARAAARGALSADCAAAVSHIYICVVGAFFGVAYDLSARVTLNFREVVTLTGGCSSSRSGAAAARGQPGPRAPAWALAARAPARAAGAAPPIRCYW